MNQKALYGILAAIIIILIGLWAFNARRGGDATDTSTTTPATSTADVSDEDVLSASPAPLSLASSAGNLTDGAYTISTTESLISWKGNKPFVPGYVDTGTLGLKSGSTVDVVGGVVTKGNFIIDMESLAVTAVSTTKIPAEKLEEHLRSDDFLSVATYPTAGFVIKHVANGTVTGELTIKGITKTITFPATIVSETPTRLVADASVTLNRANWDIRYGSGSFFEDLGDAVIDDKVAVELHLVATR